MTYSEIKELCKQGRTGIIPKWKGYLKWNYGLDELQFVNNNYVMTQSELEGNYGITNRTDLFYII